MDVTAKETTFLTANVKHWIPVSSASIAKNTWYCFLGK